MRKAFYRQHRPKKLSEVVGQEHITTTLSNAIKTGNISHAYLLTGPKGVGKTSIARIMAHEINNLPYEDAQTHLDIIEIDAASNRRIDEIRDLRDKIHIAPTSAKYKVYIIDEVHMLTREAFNALLKTLEEPPEHVVFILATTEPHKVPETIVSRTQQFSFRAVPEALVAGQLEAIAKLEGIKIDKEAVNLIASHGEGSFRDSISLLDQLSSSGESISTDSVRLVVGLPENSKLASLIGSIHEGRIDAIVDQLQDFKAHGVSSAVVSKQLIAMLRAELLGPKTVIPKAQLLELIETLMLVPTKADPAMALEVALLKHAVASSETEKVEVGRSKVEVSGVEVGRSKVEAAELSTPYSVLSTPNSKIQDPRSKISNEPWADVLLSAKKQHNSLYGVLRMAQMTTSDNEIQLGFKFPFHVKQVLQAKNLDKLHGLVSASFKNPMKVSVTIAENYEEPLHTLSPDQEKGAVQPSSNDPVVASLSNIFGPVELID